MIECEQDIEVIRETWISVEIDRYAPDDEISYFLVRLQIPAKLIDNLP